MQVARPEPCGFGAGAIAAANRLSAREILAAVAGARARKRLSEELRRPGGSRKLGIYAKPSCGFGGEHPSRAGSKSASRGARRGRLPPGAHPRMDAIEE